MRRKWFHIAALVVLVAGGLIPARAQDPDDAKRGVARLSFVNGDVSVQRGDSGDWVAASLNAPLLTNDRISTGPNSRAEVQFDANSVLRIGGEAVVTLTQLETGRYQMDVGRGTVSFRVLRPSNLDIELDTPSVSVRPSRQGTYRISVLDSGDSEITARSGDVEIFTPRGSQWVSSGQMMMARGTAADPEFQIVAAAAQDEWDRWSDSRDRLVTASPSYQYVPPGVYGAEELDQNGSWVNVPSYGSVWQPVVAPGWAPYRYGRWVWEDWYGWTWVSYDPFGWAPYHYGRWFYEPAYGWLWYPGAIGVRHYWSPALVAFFGFGGGGVAVGFGNVGWVPLAPYEVLHPWWGRGFYGRPEYFNRSVSLINVNVVNTYRNARLTNGFTAVSGSDFRAGRFNSFVRPSAEDLRQASFSRGPIPIAPERANLQFASRQPAFVPRNTGANRVFQYRQPTPAARLNFSGGAAAVPRAGGFGSPVERPQTSGPAAGGWQRFGEPRGIAPASIPPRSEAAPQTASRGWSRFGEPAVAARPVVQQTTPRPEYQNQPMPANPSFGFNAGSRPESLRVAPPVVRERPSAGYSAPRPEGRATRAPSGGGGERGSHGGGNGGGGHRGR